jgi:intein/homing endonuclease
LKKYSSQQYTISKPHYFQNIKKDVEVSYWFGFLRADGSRAGHPYAIILELAKKDKDRLEEFAKIIGFPLNRINFRTRYKWYKGKLKKYDVGRLQFICKPMAADIDNLGFQSSKAEQKIVPDYVIEAIKEAKEKTKQTNIDWRLNLPGQIALAFLLGFYDGDGTYIGGKSAVIYSSSKQFLEHIKELFGIRNKVLEAIAPGKEVIVFDNDFISKGSYSLALGSKLFEMMINSYQHSMKRKRP